MIDETVQSFAKGLDVLRSFSGRSSQTITDVSERTGLTRAAARRFLRTLCQTGLATTDGKSFRLSPAVLELGQAYLSGKTEQQALLDILMDVTRQIGESASAAVLDGTDIIYVSRSAARDRVVSIGLSIGSRLPAHATSMGQALLAQLDPAALDAYFAAARLVALTPHTLTTRKALETRLTEVRARGYAIVTDELEVGLRSMAVPVVSPGRPGIAINTSAQSARVTAEAMVSGYLPVLRRAARQIQGSGLF